MKICVIGGTGNISSSIVSQLVKRGHDVYCFNRGLSGKVPKEVHQITGDRNDEKKFAQKCVVVLGNRTRDLTKKGFFSRKVFFPESNPRHHFRERTLASYAT